MNRENDASPRIAPLDVDDIDPEIREMFGDRELLNIFRTLAVHPKLLKRWLVFGNHVLGKSTLAPRDRELVILRTGWNSGSAYEFSQHTVIGRAAGLTDDEIRRTTVNDLADWDERDQLLIQAADELCRDSIIGDETWSGLSGHFDERQLLDLIFTVGQYQLVSMALNSLGVQLEAGATGFPS